MCSTIVAIAIFEMQAIVFARNAGNYSFRNASNLNFQDAGNYNSPKCRQSYLSEMLIIIELGQSPTYESELSCWPPAGMIVLVMICASNYNHNYGRSQEI